MKIQCMAKNLTKPFNRCKREDTRQFTMPNTGVVYDAVCTKHIEQINKGKNVHFILEGTIRPTVAVIGDTHIDLKTGVETTQLRLEEEAEMPNKKTRSQEILEKDAKKKAIEDAAKSSRVINTIEEGVPGVHKKVYFMVSGHRWVNNKAVFAAMLLILDRIIAKFGAANVVVVSGAAQGADYLWARVAKVKGVELQLYIPHETGYWDAYHTKEGFPSKANWDAMLDYASEIHYSVPTSTKWHYSMNFKRNIDMINVTDHYIIVSKLEPKELAKEKRGGTRHAVVELIKRGVTQVNWINSETGETKWVTLQ